MEETMLPRTPLDKRTGVTEAFFVLSQLADIYEMWKLGGFDRFVETFFSPMWDDETTDGDTQAEQIKDVEDMTSWEGEPLIPGFKEGCVAIAVLLTSLAYVVQAMKAKKKKTVSWSYAVEAARWLGVLQGLISGRAQGSDLALQKSLKAALDARHTPTRAMNEESVRLYTSRDNWKSRRQAAKAIFPQIQAFGKEKFGKTLSVDRGEQTVYEWLTEHDKQEKN